MTASHLPLNPAVDAERVFRQPVVSIGSHPENELVLGGAGVLPFHATLVLEEGGTMRLIPIADGAPTLVAGADLQGAPAVLNATQSVQIGQHLLVFQPNGGGSLRVVIHSLAENETPIQTYNAGDESVILLHVLSGEAEVDVEQTALYELEVVNAGPIVASFAVMVKGAPDRWVEVLPNAFNLMEGERHRVQIRVTPPRHPDSTAGLHTLEVVAYSPNYSGQMQTASLALTINPYYEFAVGNLNPKDQRIPWRKRTGLTYLPIANQGNGPAEFNLLAVDDENGCSFDFCLSDELQLNRQATLQLQAGESADLPIQITPLKNPMFAMRNKRYHYTTTVQIPQKAATPQSISGSATSVPLFGWWSIVLSVATLLLVMFFLLQPNIRSFEAVAGKDVIELGDSTKLVWNVSPFATRLSLSNVETPISRGQVSLTVAPTQSTTYELVSGNWLSGLFGLDQKRSVSVLVVPPSPQINVFEVDQTRVAEGKPVNVRWSVLEANEALLTIDGVVYSLPPDKFSGEQEVVLEKDALITLEAKNASGSELRSYFINVVEPYININSFTVWVRPDAVAGNPLGPAMASVSTGGKLFSRVDAPDPNFPVKFVELVPDSGSDTGYRVTFNPAVREELQKGEQVILEWNIDGVDTVQIAPFTDALPSRGSQPFFPQESMNFVLTAESGDLKGIFMLPVKVYDGEPPKAPAIEFFRGAPLSMQGGGDVEFTWSVSGEWTNVNLSNADGILADNLNPVGFKKLNIKKTSTIILTAYNGTLSSAQPLEVTVDPALAEIGLYFKSVFPESGRMSINDSVQVTVGFYDPAKSNLTSVPPVYVEPDALPTGQVFVTDGVSICTISLPGRTCDLVFSTPGDPKVITASYPGDKVYLPADTDKPYDGYIAVIGSTVSLTPTYYLLDQSNTTPTPVGSPISINSSPLKLDTGLYIQVRVIPQGVPLSKDNPGKVTLNICQQQTNSSGQLEVKPGTCQPISTSTVALDASGTQGTAVLALRSFPKAGRFALLVSFSAPGFIPQDRAEFNVQVEPIPIYLSLASCTDPKNFTGCEIGTSDPASTKIIFDIRKVSDGQMLSSQLTPPPTAAFRVYEVSGATETPWNCRVIPITENGKDYHKLECSADFSSGGGVRTPVNVNYRFDNSKGENYSMSGTPLAAPFQLRVKINTQISLDSTRFLNIKVGQSIQLTSSTTTNTAAPNGAVILTDYAFRGITSNGDIQLIADAPGVLGIDPANSNTTSDNCTVDAAGQIVTMKSINVDCAVYFTKVGTVKLTTSFYDDPNYYNSSSLVPLSVSVARQDGVTLTWKQGASYADWGDLSAINPNTTLPVRLILGGPSGFTGQSLSGKNLTINLTITDNPNGGSCQVSGRFPSATAAINTSTSTPYADFSIRCDKEPMTIVISASLDDSTNFSYAAGQTTSRILGIANRGNRIMEVTFTRVADSDPVISGSSLKTIYMGETYSMWVKVYPLWADASEYSTYTTRRGVINAYLATDPTVFIDLPASLASLIDSTTCSSPRAPTSPNDIAIRLDTFAVVNYFGNTNLDTTGITDIALYNNTPCTLRFKSGTELSTSQGPTTFSFTITNPNYSSQVWTASNPYSTSGLTKQAVTITPSFTSYNAFIDDTARTLTLNFTPAVSGTSLAPLSTSSSYSAQISNSITCTNLISATSITGSRGASLTLSPTSLGGTTCSSTLNIDYLGNDWFKSNNATNVAVSVVKHSPSVAAIEFKQGANFVTFQPTYPNMKVGQALDMRVRVSDGDGLGHTLVPSGTVEVWMENSSGDVLDPAAATPTYTVTLGPGITYNSGSKAYQMVLNASGEALFTLNFGAAANNLTLKYRYLGSSLFNASSTLSAGSITFAP